MKVYITGVLLILLAVGTAGCVFENNFMGDNSTKNYTGYGVSFNYPGDWMVISDNTTGVRTIVVSKRTNSTFTPTQIQIQPMPNNGMSKEGAISSLQENYSPGWTKVSNNTLTIDGETAYGSVFLVNDSHFGDLMRINQIILVKNETTYVILLQAPDNEFDTEEPVFDMVLDSFKVV